MLSSLKVLDRYDGLLLMLILLHVMLVPHNSANESVYLQVVHDITYRGTRWGTLLRHHHFNSSIQAQHNFLGELVLGILAIGPVRLIYNLWRARNWALQQPIPHPLALLLRSWMEPKLPALILIRCILGSLSWLAWTQLRYALPNAHTRTSFARFLCAQFHPIFYASRVLPDTFASIAASFAYGLHLRGHELACTVLLSFSAIVWRFEVAVFLLCFSLLGVIVSTEAQLRSRKLLSLGIATLKGGVAAGALSMLMKSSVVQRVLSPQWDVLYSGAAVHQTWEWKLQPSWWYWTSALPRALLPIPVYFPLFPVGLLRIPDARQTALPALAFVASLSVFSPKELRFILPTIPLINAAAGMTLGRLHEFGWTAIESNKLHQAAVALNELDARPYRRVLKEAKRKRLVIQVVRLCQMSLFVGALAAHIGGLSVAMRSYPGGEALSALHRAHGLAQRNSGSLECPEPFVYIDPLSSMTGISPFLEIPGWKYSVGEHHSSKNVDWSVYTHLVTERDSVPGFEPVYAAKAFDGFSLRYPFLHFTERIHVLRRLTRAPVTNQSMDHQLPLPGCWPARLPWT
ncbi:hypothetical protein CCYA_CCYA09G2502 [Cyanidiococcus yangmingshanensis]|nr:hypothetical protein CCYA_CCYA09G2502 [Cyanidiococcus yangmingshanensis]